MFDAMDLLKLQTESSLAMAHYKYGNNELYVFTREAHHDSQGFYKAIIRHYVNEYGGLPSEVGPAQYIELVTWDDV